MRVVQLITNGKRTISEDRQSNIKTTTTRSGVPQGSILSPIIFTIFYANLEEWVRHSILLNYADDTSTSHSRENLDSVIANLEEDTTSILQFMA